MIETAEILCVGTELLLGEVVNTNASCIGRALASLGIAVYRSTVVGDNPARLEAAFRAALRDNDLVILSGGLGPTYDDLTKETVANVLGRRLVRHEDLVLAIRAYFDATGRVMTDNNKKQADLPEGAEILANPNGTAVGMFLSAGEHGEKRVALLPGPPRELEPMVEHELVPRLLPLTDHVLASRNLLVIGIGESAIEEQLKDPMETGKNPTLAPYAKDGETRLRVTARAATKEEALALCDGLVEEIRRSPVGAYIYGVDEKSTESALVNFLKAHGKTLTVAESCTGGLLQKRLTDLSGVSAVFPGGVVTYSCEEKSRLLGIPPAFFATHSAVSAETAAAMARGARAAFGTDVAIATTGSAGPDKDPTSDEPVGTVYVGVATAAGETTLRLSLSPLRSRDFIRTVAASRAFAFALGVLKENGAGRS